MEGQEIHPPGVKGGDEYTCYHHEVSETCPRQIGVVNRFDNAVFGVKATEKGVPTDDRVASKQVNQVIGIFLANPPM